MNPILKALLKFCTTKNLFKLIRFSAATRKHTIVGKNILKGGGQRYTKHNKINNITENSRGARLLPGGLSSPWPRLSCGPDRIRSSTKLN